MSTSFAQLGLPDALVHTLKKRQIVETFPVQAAAIPDALAGRDVCGKAPTGSGKTLAFGLPLLARVDRAAPHRPRALILAPTRELAEQIKRELAPLARAADRTVIAIYGGVRYTSQKHAMRKGVDVLVATPGRLEDLIEQGAVDLCHAEIVVIDEADRMADMGFMPAVRRILDQTARERQTMLFSATLDGDIAVLSRDYQDNPVRHEAASVETEAVDASHHFWSVQHHDRVQHTADLVDASGRTIVFTRTRHGADRLARQLGKIGVDAVAIHGGRSQNQRNRALKAFSAGNTQALIATDVAARGIHVDGVASVIHFDPPSDHKDYLHRSGRTARAGATGTVVSLVTGEQKKSVRRMQRQLDLDMPIQEPDLGSIVDVAWSNDSGSSPANGRSNGAARPSNRPQSRNGQEYRNGDRPNRNDSNDRPVRPAPEQRTPAQPTSRPARTNGKAESVYVANLPWQATEDELHRLFAPFGDVHQTTIITDKRSGRSKGFGFVDMPPLAARDAVKALNGSTLEGRDLTVRIAQPRKYGG
jgi:superfamily II DNA/RNA helicase